MRKFFQVTGMLSVMLVLMTIGWYLHKGLVSIVQTQWYEDTLAEKLSGMGYRNIKLVEATAGDVSLSRTVLYPCRGTVVKFEADNTRHYRMEILGCLVPRFDAVTLMRAKLPPPTRGGFVFIDTDYFFSIIFCTMDEEIVPEEEFEGTGEQTLKRLREKLSACVKEKQEYLDGWQRMRADFANAKRDEEARRGALSSSVKAEVLSDIIPVLDSFDLALQSAGAGDWKSGVENIRSQLLAILKRHGVEPYEPLGEHLDPRMHEPVGNTKVAEEKDDQVVMQVLQRGYKNGSEVLRPAKVIIGHYEQ